MFHPSFYTLSPVIGSCLIIWFSEKDQIITKILSSKFFVGIGLISYSLYLWHYPIFAFARIKDKDLSQYDKFSLIVLTTILSIISFYLIEKPMRNKRTKFRTVLYFLLIILFFVASFNYFSIKSNGLKNRLPFVLKNIFVDNQVPWKLLKDFNGKSCYENKNFCFFNKNSNKKVFLIGDSQMAVLSYDLKSRLVSKNYQFVTSVFGDCLYFPGFDRVEIKAKKIAENCNNEYFLKLENLLNINNDSIIIFGGMFPKYLTNELFNNKKDVNQKIIWNQKFIRVDKFEDIQSSFISSVNKLAKNNKIILIYPIPEFDRNISQEVFNQYSEDFLYFKKKINNFSISYDLYKIRTKSSFEMLDSIKGKNVYRVYPDRLFCDSLIKNRCIANDSENVFYFDENHQSIIGAEFINNLILREIQKIEKE